MLRVALPCRLRASVPVITVTGMYGLQIVRQLVMFDENICHNFKLVTSFVMMSLLRVSVLDLQLPLHAVYMTRFDTRTHISTLN